MPTKRDPILKFGRNADIDAGTEDVWDGGGVWVAPTTARTHAIKSSAAADAAAGRGLRTIKVIGLDSTYSLQEETVTLNGTTNVNTANTYTMIHRMYGLTSGTGYVNAGNITATAATDNTVTAQISTGEGQTLMAIYQIPLGYQGYVRRYYSSAGGVTAASLMTVRLKTRTLGGPWLVKHANEIVTTGQNMLIYSFEPFALILGEKDTIKLEGTSGAANMTLSGGFDIELVPILS